MRSRSIACWAVIFKDSIRLRIFANLSFTNPSAIPSALALSLTSSNAQHMISISYIFANIFC